MTKLKIIYRSGAQTTVEYDEKKCDVFKLIMDNPRDVSKAAPISFEGHKDLFLRLDEIVHAEVLQ